MRHAQPAFLNILTERPRLSALALGLLSATGFQPLGLWPVALVAMGLFGLIVADAPNWKSVLWRGWLFGWAHFTVSNNWIAKAFTFQAEMPEVLGWFAVPLLAIYLAVYPAIAAGFARAVVKSERGLAFALALGAGWIVTEWLRGWVFTGYAWNPFAMVLLGPFDRPGLAAMAPVMGTYAASGLAVFVSVAAMQMLRARQWFAGAIVAALLTIGMYLPPVAPREGTLAVTLVQPNIPQPDISDVTKFETNYARLAMQTRRAASQDGRRLVLWPESGMSDYLRDGYPQRFYARTTAMGSPSYARRRLGATIGEGSALLTGAIELEIGADETGRIRALAARNAVIALDHSGEILGGYSKAELVPYGEYLPMRSLLEPLGLSRLVPGAIDFWPGPGPQTLDLGEYGRASPQICYEIIFPGQVTYRADRPDFIYNPSSEGWFGSFGPPQFMAQARMRAIEEGLPVLRATTTGISAVIDARGVVRHYLGMYVAGRIDTVVPPAASATPFARFGNALSLFWAVLFLAAALVAMRRQPR
ncbi:apolipoprotein N-acyltransferase [Aurantiacibacter gangjinensis]|uniref:Apolipoprotein N-acyltransferase n=1 Tax=Aurantiacibacter gangjinensis TaxID=502682 RepID=A0A0G9MM83_9SPHN|nr:apolipoprotein N-acyltransferase [Aurantiacibacter gangjinensis]APE27715.1 Apolipoprotein N-acyltransferase [Aurantiacibacter gangjinensis]KLE31719.1 acyltransferase [Aurantiacibacter gangjinensis]